MKEKKRKEKDVFQTTILAGSKNCGLKNIKLKKCLRMDKGGLISQLITGGAFGGGPCHSNVEEEKPRPCQRSLSYPGPSVRGWWGLTITKQREPIVGGD